MVPHGPKERRSTSRSRRAVLSSWYGQSEEGILEILISTLILKHPDTQTHSTTGLTMEENSNWQKEDELYL
jgi:hypothetical protein